MVALLVFGIAAMASWALGYPAYRMLLARNILDKPNARSSHSQPTVRGGGIAIMAVTGVGLIVLGLWLRDPLISIAAALAFALAAISFLDDMVSLSALLRFGMQALLVAVFLCFLGRSHSMSSGLEGPPWLCFALMFFWMVGYSNAFNFMDGINGISGAQALVGGIGSALIIAQFRGGESVGAGFILASCVIAGAALGFLPHNFPKARMFMGDVSSVPLGFLLSAIAAWAAAKWGMRVFILFLTLHANYILDTGITLARRIARGEKWHKPHREHFYQRLVRSGKSHSFVTLSELGIQLAIIALIAAAERNIIPFTAAPAGALIVWGLFFVYAEATFRATQQKPDAGPAKGPATVKQI
jgi:UDP-N-acetylmuramyl pentapeptide phosphotransferase/UDP-N-acetylglucosamine-1-phosphate transferase